MDTVVNLEESVYALIELGKRLKQERDDAVRDSEQSRGKLAEARGKIDELSIRIRQKTDSVDAVKEEQKEEIIATIQAIITQLDAFLI